jgi:hypothetical protein
MLVSFPLPTSIPNLNRSCFYNLRNLRNLRKICSFQSEQSAESQH